jgi:hypothetical protein
MKSTTERSRGKGTVWPRQLNGTGAPILTEGEPVAICEDAGAPVAIFSEKLIASPAG